MAVPTRPAPVVTISDPHRPARDPAPYDALPEAPVRGRWTRYERLLAGLLVLLLVTAGGAARDLRSAQRVQSLVAHLHLTAASTASVTTLTGGVLWALVDVDLTSDPGHDVHLASVAADQGWAVQADVPGTLYAGATVGLTLRRRLDCSGLLERPHQLALRLAFAGGRYRTLTVPVSAGSGGDLPVNDYLCGQVDAVRALQLVSAEITWGGPMSVVDLQLADVGLAPLVVRAVQLRGFSFGRSAPLPLALPGRRSGPLDPSLLVSRELVLHATVTDCRAGRTALDAAALGGSLDRVVVQVAGRGGGGLTSVSVGGWGRYLEEQWQLLCG